MMHWEHINYLVQVAGTAAFAVTAVLAVAPKRIDLFGACVMGVITAIGGGLIRDVLAGRPTLLMTREIYAIPILFGTLLFVVLLEFLPEYRTISGAICCALIFTVRAAVIHWSLCVPDWLTTKPTSE